MKLNMTTVSRILSLQKQFRIKAYLNGMSFTALLYVTNVLHSISHAVAVISIFNADSHLLTEYFKRVTSLCNAWVSAELFFADHCFHCLSKFHQIRLALIHLFA